MPWYIEASTEPTALERQIAIGLRANSVQFYDEINKKRGLQWEASREIIATSGTKYYSILKAGTEFPVDLKSRVLGATGAGLIARVYSISSSDYTGGVEDSVYNMRPSMGVTLGAELLTGFTLVTPVANLQKVGSDIFLRANTQGNQGGFSPSEFGSNRIIDVGLQRLLEIESLGAQTITARLEFYEGPLDYPLP